MNNEQATILTIDDDIAIRKSIAAYLKDRDFTLLEAENGRMGLEIFRREKPNLILLDLRMPEVDGLEVLKAVTKESPNTPVIIVSGTGMIEDAVETLHLGAWDFLLKPIVNMEVLLHTVRKMLDRANLIQKNQEYKENLTAIFKSIKDAIITVDRNLIILEHNEAAEEICGFPGDAKGKKYESIINDCSEKCLDALNETLKTKLPSERSRFECNKQGQLRRVVSTTTFPLFDDQEEFNGCVIVVKDETRLVDLENDMHERQQFQNIIGKSNKLQRVYDLIDTLANTQTTVLITGENGTGKGLVAEALHYHKKDTKKPFVVVNCAALSDNLLESELFGHVKGAFTGAVNDRVGRFEKADGGTIFLDEIGDVSNTMQLRLLRILEEMEFERVGESTPIKIDVRIIAATNQDIRKKVKSKEFREDLFHRLKVVEINMPPLRERREDIPLLVDHFVERLNKKLNKNIKSISMDVQKIFMDYEWPGNIRELDHTLEYAFVLCNKPVITMDNLPPEFENVNTDGIRSLESTKQDDRQTIVHALAKTGWNKAKAARLLGIDRTTIYQKIKKFNITDDEA